MEAYKAPVLQIFFFSISIPLDIQDSKAARLSIQTQSPPPPPRCLPRRGTGAWGWGVPDVHSSYTLIPVQLSFHRTVFSAGMLVVILLCFQFVSSSGNEYKQVFQFFLIDHLTLPSQNHQHHQIDQESYSHKEKKRWSPRNHQVVSIM